MTTHALFREKAPGIMFLLMRDFPLSLWDAAAVLGNLGHETAGFTLMQEQKPTVPGSKGGYGWPMWTGPRRREFEDYCRRNALDPAGDKANYGFLFLELTGSEKKAIPAVSAAETLEDKVEAFERAYERAGVKHYASRNAYAAIALEAWHAAASRGAPAWAGAAPGKPASEPRPAPPVSEPAPPPKTAPASPAGAETAPRKEKEPALNSNAIHNLLNIVMWAIGLLGVIAAYLGCTTLPNGSLDCTTSTIIPPSWLPIIVAITTGVAGLKTIINLLRDGPAGLWKRQPPVS
jgi:hypothetical protein